MASGLPVIATKGGGPSEYIHDSVNGLLVEKGNPKAIVKAVLKLINDQDLYRHIAQSAIQTVKTHFNPAKVIKQHENLLLEAQTKAQKM